MKTTKLSPHQACLPDLVLALRLVVERSVPTLARPTNLALEPMPPSGDSSKVVRHPTRAILHSKMPPATPREAISKTPLLSSKEMYQCILRKVQARVDISLLHRHIQPSLSNLRPVLLG
jgi:hypothetical protein